MNRAVTGRIRTPDQRLRVFVSSTLRELAPERRAARAAIERLALAPVMFELGARPHPPRSLYRSYLDQSDVFVGIYWESYGWVAPGEEMSGLEDEYNLAPDIPMLIYVKASTRREPRLNALLDRIREDDGASYVSFDSTGHLRQMLTSDLATLLAERFDVSAARERLPSEFTNDAASTAIITVPSPVSRMLGRDDELATVTRMLAYEGRRLVTITGPGGIGKSRLAIAAARQVEESFPDGIAFVDLAPVRDAALVCPAIASALGIRDTGDLPIREKVVRALSSRRVLLVLDNFEQVIDAAADLRSLLSSTSVTMLATSRVLLRIDGERSVELHGIPDRAAIDLFTERARASKPDFTVTDDNVSDVAAICSRLDNLPLALELAAARIRVLNPAQLVARLDRSLPLLAGGNRDLPERQRTLRATIEWSTQLLTADQQELFLRLGVFQRGFPVEAAEWMAGDDALAALSALVDGSLVRERDRNSRSWFTMLATVREYTHEQLEELALLDENEGERARFYLQRTREIAPRLFGAEQSLWMRRLVDEYDEIRAVAEGLVARRQWDELAEMLWAIYPFWLVRGQLGEVGGWFSDIPQGDGEASDRARAIGELFATAISTFQRRDPHAVRDITHSADVFLRSGDRLGEGFACVSSAALQLLQSTPDVAGAQASLERAQDAADAAGDPFLLSAVAVIVGRLQLARGEIADALATFEPALLAVQSIGDRLSESAILNAMAYAYALSGDMTRARSVFREQLDISATEEHDEGIAWGLEGLAVVAAASGDIALTGRLLGAADIIRERKGLYVIAEFGIHQNFLRPLATGPVAAVLSAARREGQSIALDETVALALSEHG